MASNTTSQRHKAISNLLTMRQKPTVNRLFYRYATLLGHDNLTIQEVEDGVAIGFAVAERTPTWNPVGPRPMALVLTVAHRTLRKRLRSDELRFAAPLAHLDLTAATHPSLEIADTVDLDMRVYLNDVMADIPPEQLKLLLDRDRPMTNAEHQAIYRLREDLRRKHGSPFNDDRSR